MSDKTLTNIFDESKKHGGAASLLNKMSWVRDIPFVSYGFITQIIDKNNVVVKPVVQKGANLVEEEVSVTLLSLSSNLYELNIRPRKNGLVLLLSMDKYHPQMFDNLLMRKTLREEMGEEGEKLYSESGVIKEDDEAGYSSNSLVGILLTTIKTAAMVQRNIFTLEDKAIDEEISYALTARKHYAGFSSEFPKGSSKVSISVGEGRETDISTSAKTTLRAGMKKSSGGSFESSGKEAPIDIKLGEKAKISLESEGEIEMKFKKAQLIEGDDTFTIKVKGDITFESTSGITLKAPGSNIWQPSCIPNCLFTGAPHGGQAGGITGLKGS